METIGRATAYNKLLKIKEKGKVEDIDRYFKLMLGKDYIPAEVIILINEYYPIPQLETFNYIYMKRRKSSLFRTLINENSSSDEMVLALSSFITQVCIRLKYLSSEDKIYFANLMNVSEITNAIDKYLTKGETEDLEKQFFSVRSTLKSLFKLEKKEKN